ncbi:MAG: putative metal-dependent hydrolase [Parcubacteria group bacterium]|nr:putative metal-dependent hydrolase [Parcubacteria group bacterium]
MALYMNKNTSYEMKRSARTRTMRLSVHPDGSVVLTLPTRASVAAGEAFVRSKEKWVLKQLKRVEKYKGRTMLRSTSAEYKKHKEAAREFIHARLLYWNTFYNFIYKDVRIKNTKSRWGSCSRKGNLNFNYKLALIPERLADYIIVHELCHLKEMNHGPKFWKQVERAMPDYKERRRELKNEYVSIS